MRTKGLFCLIMLSLSLYAQQWQWAKDLGKFDNGYPRNPMITSNQTGDLFAVTDIGQMDPDYVTTSRIVRFDPSGVQQYSNSLKGRHQIWSVYADADNNFLVAGQFQYSLTISDTTYTDVGNPVAFVICFDPRGKRKWVNLLDENSNYDIAGAGNDYLLTTWNGSLKKLDSNGKILWTKRFNIQIESGYFYCVQGSYTDSHGNIFLWGGFQRNLLKVNGKTYYSVTYGPWASSFIIKLDQAANLQNVEVLKSGWLEEVKPGEDDHVYLKGTWDADFNLHIREDSLVPSLSGCHYGTFFGKLNPANSCEWLNEIQCDCGPYASLQDYTMDVSSQGNVFVHGTVNGTIKYGQGTIPLSAGLVAMKFDNNGDFVWSNQAHSWNGTAEAVGVAAGGNNAVYVAAAYKTDLTYGNISLSSNLEKSQVLALIADGNITGVNAAREFNPGVMLAPNPCERTFTCTGSKVTDIAGVYDQLGRDVKFTVNAEANSAELTGCEAGVYFVKIQLATTTSVHRLIVR